MVRLIYRQRRRILFGALFLTLAICVNFVTTSDYWLHNTAPLRIKFSVLAILMGLVAGVVASVLVVFIGAFPRWRTLVELVALYTFLRSIAALAFPGYVSSLENIHPGVVNVAVGLCGWILFKKATYGDGLARLNTRFGLRSERFVTVAGTPDEVWRRLAEGAPLPGATRVVPLPEGRLEVSVEPLAEARSRVRLVAETRSHLPRAAFQAWFDDQSGDLLDGLRARMAGKRDWSVSGRERRIAFAAA